MPLLPAVAVLPAVDAPPLAPPPLTPPAPETDGGEPALLLLPPAFGAAGPGSAPQPAMTATRVSERAQGLRSERVEVACKRGGVIGYLEAERTWTRVSATPRD